MAKPATKNPPHGDVITLEGTTTVNPGGTITFTHPKFGKVHLDIASVEIKKAQPLTAQFARQLGKAGSDPEQRMAAAQWALRKGMMSSPLRPPSHRAQR